MSNNLSPRAAALQIVRAFAAKYETHRLDEDRLAGIVFLALKEGVNPTSIIHALPKMRVATMSALQACVSMVEANSQQPEEQRTRRPKDFVAGIPQKERTPAEREVAQQAFSEMRQQLRRPKETQTSRRPQGHTTAGPSDPPAIPPPPPMPPA